MVSYYGRTSAMKEQCHLKSHGVYFILTGTRVISSSSSQISCKLSRTKIIRLSKFSLSVNGEDIMEVRVPIDRGNHRSGASEVPSQTAACYKWEYQNGKA